jgi:hypothetical protein
MPVRKESTDEAVDLDEIYAAGDIRTCNGS